MLRVGGVQLSDAEPVPPEVADETTIANGASDALALPSLTATVTPLKVPVAEGVPESLPDVVLNAAHEGLFWMLNVSASPLGSLAVGVKLYAVPTLPLVTGAPVIVGAVFDDDVPVTVILKVVSEVEETPSVATSRMPENVPAAVGVPESRPVDVLKLAHDGRLRMENVRALPSGSFAVGWNEYGLPTVAVLGGVPVSVGDLFAFGVTTIENEGSETFEEPSLTEIAMPLYVPAWFEYGVPESLPLCELKEAQPGWFAMLNVNVLWSASEAVGWKR